MVCIPSKQLRPDAEALVEGLVAGLAGQLDPLDDRAFETAERGLRAAVQEYRITGAVW